MKTTIRDFSEVAKEFALESYDFFKRKYLRQQALRNIHDFDDFPELVLQNAEALFVLSTGRCGTDFLHYLLKPVTQMDVHHEAEPKMAIASRFLYQNNINHRGGEVAFIGARYNAIQDAYLFNKIYVETNNRLTFFAPYIESLMPNAKFMHLVRHPGDFISSGMKRGYYKNDKIVDYSKIRPRESSIFQQEWDSYSRLQKIAWLWHETNLFIEDFKQKHPHKVLTIKSEQLFDQPGEVGMKLLRYMGINDPVDFKVDLGPKNEQRTGSFPKYKDWSTEQKQQIQTLVQELAQKYNYQL